MSAPNLREVRGDWRKEGGSIEDIPGTGEERYSHPQLERPITVHKGRKDSPRKLMTALRRVRAGHRSGGVRGWQSLSGGRRGPNH